MANDGNDHQAERWQARLASLETRLEMLETSIKGEADRMRMSAEAVDGVADELRGLLGGGRNLVDLLNDFGDRVAVLANLEKRVGDASREVSDEVTSKLDAEASERRDRDATLEAGFKRLVGQVGDIQARIDAAGASTTDHLAAGLDSIERRRVEDVLSLAARVDELASSLQSLRDSLPSPLSLLAPLQQKLVQLEAAVQGARSSQPDPFAAVAPLDARLDELADSLEALRDSQPKLKSLAKPLHDRLDELVASLREVKEAQGDPGAVPTLSAQVDQLAGTVQALLDGQPTATDLTGPLTARLDELDGALDALRAGLGDPAAAVAPVAQMVDELGGEVRALRGELRDEQRDPGELLAPLQAQLDQLAGSVQGLRDSQPDPATFAVPVHDHLNQIGESIQGLRESMPDPARPIESLGHQIDALTGHIQALRDHQPEPTSLLLPLHGHLNEVQGAIQGLRESQPDVASALSPFSERLDELAGALDVLRQAQTDPAAAIEPLRERIDSLAESVQVLRDVPAPEVPDPAAAIAPLTHQLDQLASAVQALHDDRPADPADAIATINDRLDAVGATLTALRDAPAPTLPDPAAAVAPLALQLDQLSGAVQALRDDQPGQRALAPIQERLDQLIASLDALHAIAERPDDLGATLTPMSARLTALDARSTATVEALAQLQGSLSGAAAQLDEVSGAVTALSTTPDTTQQRLAPIVDRLAVLLDGVTAVHGNLEQVAGAVGGLRGDRAEINALMNQVSERLEQLALSTNELHINRPDMTSSLQLIAEMVEAVRVATLDSGERLNALHEVVRTTTVGGTPEAALAPLHDDLTALTQRIAATEGRFDDVLSGIQVTVDQLEQAGRTRADRSSAVDAQLEQLKAELHTRLAASEDRQAETLVTLTTRLEAAAGDAQAARVAADAAHAVLTDTPTDTRSVDELAALRAVADETANRVADANAAAQATGVAVAELLRHLQSQPDSTTVDAGLDARFAQLTAWLDSVVNELSKSVRESNAEVAQALANPAQGPSGVDAAHLESSLARATEEIRSRIDAQTAHIPELTAAAHANTAAVDARLTQLADRIVSLGDGLTGAMDSISALGTRLNEIQVSVASAAAAVQSPAVTPLDPAHLEAALSRTAEDLRARIDAHAGQLPDLLTAATAGTAGVVEAQVAALGQRVAGLSEGVAATAATLNGITARLDQVQLGVATAASQPPAAPGMDAADLDAALARATNDLRVRIDAFQQNADALAARVDMQTDRLLESMAASNPTTRDDIARVDAGLVDLRTRIAALSDVAEGITALRSAVSQQPDLSAYVTPLSSSLQDMRADMQGTRADVAALGRAVAEIRADSRQGNQEMGGAGAALVASAAAAMARLEGRIDSEFDAVSRQMEALGTLVSQAIDSIHRMESQVVGTQPVSERVRSAASNVLESLRNTSRNRGTLRYGNPPPPELEE